MEHEAVEGAPWSRESFQFTRSGLAQASGGMLQSQIQHIDQLESQLLQDGTVWSEEALLEELRSADLSQVNLASASNSSSQGGSSTPAQSRDNGSLSAQMQKSPTGKKVEFNEDNNVIIFTLGTISPWDSDKDSQHSDGTVQHGKECDGDRTQGQETEEPDDKAVQSAIKKHGIKWKVSTWVYKNKQPTIQVLCDAFLAKWSRKDKYCQMFERWYSHIGQWTQAIRKHELIMLDQLPITVIALQCIKQLECLEPLKNNLAAMCRVIRNIKGPGRIFIVSAVPNPGLLQYWDQEHCNIISYCSMRSQTSISSSKVCFIATWRSTCGKGRDQERHTAASIRVFY